MSAHRSTGKLQSDKLRKGEKSDSIVPSSLRDPPSSAEGRNTNPNRIKHEQPLTSNDEDTQPDTPDKLRPKSSRDRDRAGQKPPSAAPNGRAKSSHEGKTATDEKTSGVERHRKSVHASLHSDGEEGELKSASPKRKSEKKKPSSATRGSSRFQTQGRGMMDSNPQPYVLQSDLRKGHNYYLYCLGKIYDVSDMRRRKEMQYWNLLARQRQLGFHSPKECEVYMRYLSRPRTAQYSTAYSGQYRTKSTEGRRRREETDRRTRTVSAADGRGRTVADKEDRDQKESGGDNKGTAVGSKTAPVSSKTAPVSSKTAPVSSKTAPVSSKTAPVSSRTAPVSSKRRPVTSESRSVSSKTRPVSSKPRAVSSKAPRLDSSKEVRRVSRDEVGDEEINRQRNNETTDEDNEVSQNDEEKTKNRRNSQSGKDKRRTEDEQKPSVPLTSKAAEAGNESEEETESSDSDESQRRSNIRPSDGGDNRPVDATKSDGRSTEEASSDDDDAW